MALTETIVWSVPPDLPGVEILSVENNQRPWCVYHETYTICNINKFVDENRVPRSGEAEWTYRRGLHQNAARTLMLLEPGEIHQNTKTPPPCDFSVVQIDPKLVNRAASEMAMHPNPHFKKAVATTPGLYYAFVQFHDALRKETSLLDRQSQLENCIGVLLTSYCEQTVALPFHPGRRRLERARDFLKGRFSEKIMLDQLAEISGLSRFHFLRAFTREFGLPPHQYQTSLRIEYVHKELKSGRSACSIEAGFSDYSHLTRHFQARMGVTPARYASMVRFGKTCQRQGTRSSDSNNVL